MAPLPARWEGRIGTWESKKKESNRGKNDAIEEALNRVGKTSSRLGSGNIPAPIPELRREKQLKKGKNNLFILNGGVLQGD